MVNPDQVAATVAVFRVLNVQEIRDELGDAVTSVRPYGGGSQEHRDAVLRVAREARRKGETPARAVMRVFDVARPTAYKWLRDYNTEVDDVE